MHLLLGCALAVLLLFLAWAFPGALRRQRVTADDATFWAKVCISVARRAAYSSSTGMWGLIALDSGEMNGGEGGVGGGYPLAVWWY